MTAELERRYVADKYPGPTWKARVQLMPEAQITAIYNRMIGANAKPPKTENTTKNFLRGRQVL